MQETERKTSTSTRRSAIASVAALAAGLGAPAIAKAVPSSAAATSNPDADLIALCRSFAERNFEDWYQWQAADGDDDFPEVDWDGYRRIIAMRATTPEGWRAKALACAAWNIETFDDADKHNARDSHDLFRLSLIRDLMMDERDAIMRRLRAEFGPLPARYTANGVWLGYSIKEEEALEARDAEAAEFQQSIMLSALTDDALQERLKAQRLLAAVSLKCQRELEDEAARRGLAIVEDPASTALALGAT